MKSSWLVAVIIFLLLLSGCSAMAGGVEHWPASLLAVAVMVPVKMANDRYKVLAWPMEFALIAAVTMIVFNLVLLYFTETPF